MKIGIIQNVTLNDHRAVNSHNVACELERRGITVDMILQKTDEDLQYKNRPYNLIQIPGETYSIPGQIRFVTASFTPLKKGSYHIIHARNPFSSIFSATILRKMGAITSKIVYDMRGLWIDFGVLSGKISPHLLYVLKKTENYLIKRCDHVIALSPVLKDELCSRGVDREKISVIFGAGVDIEKVESVAPAKKDKDTTVIGYIGSISVSRQSDKIIEAFKKLKRKDIYLVMVGPVGEPHIFRELTSNYKNIVLTGYLPQEKAFQYLKSFDIVLSYHGVDHPAYNVAVPVKVFEYMASGVPIVVTDHQMYKNVLEDGKTAVLTGQNPEEFAKGIEYLLENPSIAEKISARARSEVEKYSIKNVVDQLESVYLNLLE